MANATYEHVAAAAEALIAAGQKASVRLVIERIGGGSPNTVLKLLNDWKAGRPVVRVSDVDLDVAITQSIKSQMQRVAETAAQAAEEKAAAALDDLATLSEASALAEQAIASLTTELDTAKQQSSDFVAQMKDEQADHERIVTSLTQTIEQLKGELSDERKRSDEAQTALAKSEVRLEVVPGMQDEIERLRAALETMRDANHDLEKQVASLETKAAVSQANYLNTAKALESVTAKNVALDEDCSRFISDVHRATMQAQMYQNQLDTAAREIEALKQRLQEFKSVSKKTEPKTAEDAPVAPTAAKKTATTTKK